MYQIANYKTLGLKALPEDIAKTSQPQTWHIPRGTKITGKAVQDLEVSGNSKEGPCEAMPRNIKSTLYNPVRGQPIDWCVLARKHSAVTPDLLVLPALCETACSVPCSFGPVPKGCILSYQQKPSEDCILNISDGIGFPELPASNVMRNTYSTVLGGGRVVRRCWVNFQCRGVLLTWNTVGQAPIVLAVGAGGGCLDIFSLLYHFSFLSPSLWETARYRLKYCLKGPLSPKQPTNQPIHCSIISTVSQT